MAGYKGGADQTVIQAAKSAVAIPKGYHASIWDYKDELATFVNGLAGVAKFVVSKVDAANERASGITGFEEGINKEFWSANNTEYFTGLKGKMSEASKIMNTSLPFTKAYKEAERIWSDGRASLDKLKGDEEKLEEVIKRIKECSGPNQSAFNNPMLKSLMEEINGGSGMFDQSVRFTDDGIVVMGPSGEEMFLEDLPNISSKTDGKVTHDLVNTQITGAVDLKSKGNWNDRNKYLVRQNISGHLDAQTSGIIGSAAFDYEHYTADGPMSFADHLMATSGPYNEAFNEWKNTSGIGASQAEIKETKMMMAQELWDDNQSMKDEYLDFVMDNVLDFQVGEQRVVSTNKKKKKKTEERILIEDERNDDKDGLGIEGDVEGDDTVDDLISRYGEKATTFNLEKSKKTSIVNSLVSKGFNIKGFGSARAKRAITEIDKYLKNDRTYDFQMFFDNHFDFSGVTRPGLIPGAGMMGGNEDWIDARAAWKQIKLAYSNNPLLKNIDKLDLEGQLGGGEDSGRYTTNPDIEAFLKSNAIGGYTPPVNVRKSR